MKPILFILLISLFSAKKPTESDDVTTALNLTLKDNFFTPYKQNGRLLLVVNDAVYKALLPTDMDTATYKIDTHPRATKFLQLDECLETPEMIRMQISCYVANREFALLYSTSYKKTNGKLELNKAVSPHIDTISLKVPPPGIQPPNKR